LRFIGNDLHIFLAHVYSFKSKRAQIMTKVFDIITY
jgi:hypothetical protein